MSHVLDDLQWRGLLAHSTDLDALRAEMIGTMRDMSVNPQVFSVVQAATQARIEGGLNTVVDSTNLRARDRRALRDCVPADGKILYHVIDRPLEEKHRDAGWRADVKVARRDGTMVSLIDKMHQSFKGSIKAILAARRSGRPTAQETAFVPLPAGQHA